MRRTLKKFVTERQTDVAEIAWESIRRNKEYQSFYAKVKSGQAAWASPQKENVAPFAQLQIYRNMFKPQNEWGITAPIPPEKKFGKEFGAGIKGRQLWTLTHFSQNTSAVYSQPIDNTTIAFLVNLRCPRLIIEEAFEKSLTQHFKDMKTDGKLRHRLRLSRGKSIAMKWYRWAFPLYDRIEKKKEATQRVGKKKIYWKLLSRNKSEKKIRDAYVAIKQLVEGGFRLIT